MKIIAFFCIITVSTLFSSAEGNWSIEKLILSLKFWFSSCVGMGYIFRRSDANITTTKRPRYYNCYFIADEELESQQCMEVLNENPCEQEGNFINLRECNIYIQCMRGYINWFCWKNAFVSRKYQKLVVLLTANHSDHLLDNILCWKFFNFMFSLILSKMSTTLKKGNFWRLIQKQSFCLEFVSTLLINNMNSVAFLELLNMVRPRAGHERSFVCS